MERQPAKLKQGPAEADSKGDATHRLARLPGHRRAPDQGLFVIGDALFSVLALSGASTAVTDASEVQGLRELMASLRPPTLGQVGLEAALRDHVGAFARRSGVDSSPGAGVTLRAMFRVPAAS